jgi:hypothetical protein
MPRYFDIRATVLIVVGSGILPEEEDRPLAYDLKRAIAAQIYEELPVAFTRDERVFIQVSEPPGKRAAVWGMDQETTREAVERFVKDGLLDRFLNMVWKRT